MCSRTVSHAGQSAGPARWVDDLAPIGPEDWSYERAAHLLERAGFGGTPEEIRALAAMTPEAGGREPGPLPVDRQQPPAPFEHSGVWDPALDPFPVSRPATTELAKAKGEALGVDGEAAAATGACSRS